MSLTRDLARLHSDSDGNLILANNLTVDTNTLKVDAANNRVGIGTATPAAPLDIAGSNGVLAKLGATTELQIYADNNEISFRADADNDENDTIFTFDIDNSEKVRFNTLGHVGIGTTAPDANSFGAGHGILAVASETGSAKTAMLNLIGDGNDTADTRVASVFFNDASATGAGATLAGVEAYRASNHATDPGADLVFSTNIGSTGGYAEKMRISSNGYITTPLQPAFNATRNVGQNISGTVTLDFNVVRSNASNSYNGSTGIFTAPISGQYLFTHKALYYAFSNSEYLDLYSYVNSSIRNRYEQTGNSGVHTQVNYAEIVYLNTNDTFKLVASNRNTGSFSMYANENHFSGRLLG